MICCHKLGISVGHNGISHTWPRVILPFHIPNVDFIGKSALDKIWTKNMNARNWSYILFVCAFGREATFVCAYPTQQSAKYFLQSSRNKKNWPLYCFTRKKTPRMIINIFCFMRSPCPPAFYIQSRPRLFSRTFMH